jgi:glucosamine kinase
MDLYLGIDAGGTHTRARLINDAGEVIGTGEAGPPICGSALPKPCLRWSWPAARRSPTQRSERSISPRFRAGLGIAGLNRRGVLAALQEHPFPFRSIAFASDAAIANLGAHGGADGAIVIIGTGSIGFGRVGEEVFTVGGYGFPVSDEGSGADLGMRAIRRALWARDGRIPHSPMTDELLKIFMGARARSSTGPARRRRQTMPSWRRW